MKLNKKVLLIAVVLGLATAVALNFYIKSLDKPAMVTIPHAEIVVAKSTIPAHTRITADMLDKQSIPSDVLHPEAITSMDKVVGGITRSEIIKGEQVLSSRVVMDETKASLSYRIPENMRAISLPVGEVSGVAGYISPGDRIDIIVTYTDEDIVKQTTTYTVFQNLLVLATGEFTKEKDNDERQVVGTLTISVTPEQAELLAWMWMVMAID